MLQCMDKEKPDFQMAQSFDRAATPKEVSELKITQLLVGRRAYSLSAAHILEQLAPASNQAKGFANILEKRNRI